MDVASRTGDTPDIKAMPAKPPFWLTDFEWREGALRIRKTGISLRVTGALINEIAHWAVWLVILWVAGLRTRLSAAPRQNLWFAPDTPRPWYLLRAAAIWAGFDVADASSNARASFYFDDSTEGQPAPSLSPRRFNHGCTDISKGHVAQVFEEVFGYPLAVDPRTAQGEIVEKSERNGVHDGRIVLAPLEPKPDCVYQRIVDTRDDADCCHDLRTPCVGGEAVLVWIKVKTPEGRFSINNRSARLADPAEVYSVDERDLIREFSARMGLDWGGLDILRDRHDGRIYIVDVNKTDLGPVIALPWSDKVRSMNRLSRALKRLIRP